MSQNDTESITLEARKCDIQDALNAMMNAGDCRKRLGEVEIAIDWFRAKLDAEYQNHTNGEEIPEYTIAYMKAEKIACSIEDSFRELWEMVKWEDREDNDDE